AIPTPFFPHRAAPHPPPHSFPTRRSSDLSPHAKMAEKGEVRHIQTWLIRLYPLYADISSWTPLIWYRRYRGDLLGLPHPITACRSEEHTPELQSRENLVCRLLLEKKNKNT